jgi:hypothetical protein
MAFTIDREHFSVGNKRGVIISVSVDSASGNVDTGLSVIDGVGMCSISMATDGINVKRNVGSGATARPGILNINSAASGDSIQFIVYGR